MAPLINKCNNEQGKHLKLKNWDKCAVCEQKCQYFHYDVRCCEACKHFFRRSISCIKDYYCAKNRTKCDITNGKGPKCKKCRLDKCILAGMDARGVGSQKYSTREMVEFVEKRRRELEKEFVEKRLMQKGPILVKKEEEPTKPIQMENNAITNLAMQNARLLEYLVDVERKVRRIRDSRTEVPEFFYQNCNTFEQVLNRPFNLIQLAPHFSAELPDQFSQAMIDAVLKGGPICQRPPYLAMDLLLSFEIAKTMPFFRLLGTADQICHLSTVTMPLFVLSNGFYSWQQHAATFVTPMGYAPINLILDSAPLYKDNESPNKMAKKVLCEAMIPFIRANLSIEEFVLLRAIIYSHMLSSGLSNSSQQILLQEATKYSGILLNFLQCKHGQLGGARKYAELLSLVEFCFNSGAQHRQWLTYIANVKDQNNFNKVMPPVLGQLCTRGPMELPQLAPL